MEIGYLDTPEEWRDLFIMMFMVAGTIMFLTIIIVTAVAGFLSWSILGRVRKILKDNITPATENARATAENIRGTVQYMSESAIKPIVKVYGVGAGAKRFVGVAARFARKKPGA